MPVTHSAPDARSISADDPIQAINKMFELSGHPGITQSRNGSITTGALDLAVTITFGTPLSTASYEVFIQPKSAVGVQTFASALTTSGFTLNLSTGVVATFSYLAVENT